MDRFIDFFKRHPVGVAVAVVATVLLIYLMTRSSGSSSSGVVSYGPSDAAVAANAQITIAQLAKDTAALQSNAAVQINAANVAGAVDINSANATAATQQAEYAMNVANNQASTTLQMYDMETTTNALAAIASVIPQTQANSLAAGQETDAAGYGLMEMFKNLLSAKNGVGPTLTQVSSSAQGTTTMVYDQSGNAKGGYMSALNEDGFFTSKINSSGQAEGMEWNGVDFWSKPH